MSIVIRSFCRFQKWVLFCDGFSSEFVNYLNQNGEVYSSKLPKHEHNKRPKENSNQKEEVIEE